MPDAFAIVGNIVTTLAAINTATTPPGSPRPYRTTVARCERGIRTFDETGPADRPFIGVARLSTDYDNEINGLYENQIRIKVVGHVTGSSEVPRDTALDALENDIKAALHVDTTRGGIATWTKVKRVITDEADPIQRDHGTLEMDVLVELEDDFLVAP